MQNLVKDFEGKLIPKNKARRIKNELGKFEYFEEDKSCIGMPDGKWYRTTTGKILYDWSKKEWVFAEGFKGVKGLVDDGSFGSYTDATRQVPICFKKDTFVRKSTYDPYSKNLSNTEFKETRWNKGFAINEQVALAFGYKESIFDGLFYKVNDCSEEDLVKMMTPNIPTAERVNTYSLDDDKDYRAHLENVYDSNEFKAPIELVNFARKYMPYTFGVEIEVQNGFVPKRVREPLGFRICRDGSLGEGVEWVSIPMESAKGLWAIKLMCDEVTRRCVLSNKCSVHVHFGNVRRDKLYVVSLWNLLTKIQPELRKYFPYSRTNSIREDSKIYANLLPDLNIQGPAMLKCKEDSSFRLAVTNEFNKIYSYLNNGHPLGEKYDEALVKDTREEIIKGKVQTKYCYRVKTYNYTTRLPRHAVQGRKWERQTRYLLCNILNMFFSHSRTVEFRIHEASANFDKILLYMCICTAILNYAKNFDSVLSNEKITMDDILKDSFPTKIAAHLKEYLKTRKSVFCTISDTFKSNWSSVEKTWMDSDKNFQFNNKRIYNL